MKFIDHDGTLVPHIPRAPEIDGGFLEVILQSLSVNGNFLGFISVAAIVGFLGLLWTIYAVLAYLLAIIFLLLYIYASVRWMQYLRLQEEQLRNEEALWDEHHRGIKKNGRLEEVFAHIESERPNDWKLAIIEADIVLDDLLKERGYAGNSLGERLRGISPSQLATLDDAWEAHKVRNQIAHGGADFVLTRRLAEETINRYRRVFIEFGIA